MKKVALFIVATMTLFGVGCRPLTYDWADVEQELESKLTSVPVPGNSLVVRHRGVKVYQRAFGTYTLDTVVPIASASKWLTGATVMALVDEGLLSLDTTVGSVLPQFTGVKGTVTVRQLMSHTSGIRTSPDCVGLQTTTLAACVDLIAGYALVHAPGAQFRYGSGGMTVAGRMIEVITGQSFNAAFQSRIAGPVGMPATRFAGPNPNPAGSAISSLVDYDRFVTTIANGGQIDGRRVLSTESVATMQQDQTGGAPIVLASAIRKSLGSRYGIGHWRDVLDQSSGGIEVSSPGAFGFHPWIDHTRDLSGVYLVYSPDEDGTGGWGIKDAVRRAVDEAVSAG